MSSMWRAFWLWMRGGIGILMLVTVAMNAGISLAAAAAARVILDPVTDFEISAALQRQFVLPYLLELTDQTDVTRTAAIATEVEKLTGLLRSFGYLDARIEVQESASPDGFLRLRPYPGLLYRIGWIRVDGLPPQDVKVAEALQTALGDLISGQVGRNATSGALADIRTGVLWRLREASYAGAKIVDLSIKTEAETRTVGIVLNIASGPTVRFGTVRFSGSVAMNSPRLSEFVPFRAGDPYSASAIASLRDALEATNKFRRIQISLGHQPDAANLTEIVVALRDRPPDPVALAGSRGYGPALLLATMILIVIRQCASATSLWRIAPVRRTFAVTVLAMVATSFVVVVQRVISFFA